MAENKKPQFTQRDMEVSAKAWACLEGDAKIDFSKLAELAGYKTAASARECWRTTKIRLMAAAGVDKDGKSVPETPAGKTTKAASAGSASTATKRKRAAKKTAPVAAAAADSNDDYEADADADGDDTTNGAGDGSPVHPKKKSRAAAAGGGGGSGPAVRGGGRKKKAPKSEEIIMEPIFDEGEELAGGHGTSLEDDIVGVDAMVKAEEAHGVEMPMAIDEV
ncbi:hypothetical protein PG993_008847 [Apiospora rasikravindrae]|uniref:Uncharacterized protein n=1 Tax=Apiospora rasikravindrae TaxID=990691 RepID=A0ABR1SPI5_9PEZI